MKTFPGEFDGLDAWLRRPEHKQLRRHFVPLTECSFEQANYRTVFLSENELQSPNLYKKLNESSSQSSTGDPRCVNSWEQKFYEERTRKVADALRSEEEELRAQRELGIGAISQSRDLQESSPLKVQLEELTEALHAFLDEVKGKLKRPTEEDSAEEDPAEDPAEEDPAAAQGEVGQEGEEPGEEPGEEAQGEVGQAGTEQPGEEAEGKPDLDFNLAKRFNGINDPKILVTELVQLISDLGKAIPSVKPIADQLLDIL